MLSSILYPLLFLTSVTSALSINKRDTVLVSDVHAIDSGVKTLTAHVKAYTSGALPTSIINGGPIFADVVNIHLTNRKGFADANLSP
ncbi:hypothetical protein LTS18_009039, partial [Coniosporium uncinatum]